RIERRQDCPLLLSRQIRDMLACQHETAIDSAEVAVMQAPRIVTPSGRLSNSGTLAMLMAIRRASSRVSRLASCRNEAGAARLIIAGPRNIAPLDEGRSPRPALLSGMAVPATPAAWR